MTIELALLPRVSYRDQEIMGARLRNLLALLAGDLRAGCSAARLMDGLWPDVQPEHPTKALQVLVSRARSTLGSGLIASTPAGYRLTLDEEQVDASAVLLRTAASARHARAGDHAAALAEAEAGLALWDGTASADTPLADPLSALRAERAATHRSLTRARALALSRVGRCAEALEPLADVARDRPLDEEVLLELLQCEAATAGPSTALARYEAYRESLRDELGSDPGAPLQAVHRQLLQATAPASRHGVAHEPNPLIGREEDTAAVTALLRTSRVTSIVGPGGLGKTRLAHAVGREAEQRVVHVVALASVTTDEDVVDEVASALGVGESRTPVGRIPVPTDGVAGIAGALGPGAALLVLDNCEQVIRGVADLVQRLVAITRDLRVLTTSRAPLGLSSEAVYQLPVLPLPATVELFEQRARAARPDVELTTDVVEELCRHLDGLPLAAELAAARVRIMSVAEIARGLEDRFGLLRGGARDAPERHRTLHAVVDWSWNLLAPAGQAAMQALSVFPDGFAADAARHLLGDGMAEVLEDLVDQSLLTVADTPLGARFSMLETMRAFSSARRDAAGETGRVVDRFLAWARDFGVAYHELPFGADPYLPLARIRAEQDNLAQALRAGLDASDGATVAATGAVLAGLWTIEQNFSRLRVLGDDTAWLLSHFRPAPDLVEATRTTLTLCTMYTFVVEGPRPVRSLAALRRLPPAPPDTLIRAIAIVLGAARKGAADLRELCDSDEPLAAGGAASVMSYLAENQGDLDGALTAAERTLEAFERQRVPWAWALAHTRLSELYLQVDRAADARRHLIAALPVIDRLRVTSETVGVRWWLVLANLQLGAADEAERWLEQTERNWTDADLITHGTDADLITHTYGLGVRAEILLARGEVDGGLRLWRDAVDQLRNADESIDPDDPGVVAWTAEAEATAVIAHAHHQRPELIEDVIERLPGLASQLLATPAGQPFLVQLRVYGALLLAVAMADIVRGQRACDRRALRSGAAMVALAERFRFLRVFQPTMSPERARRAAADADRPAYDDAVSSYAGLSSEELRAAALAALAARDPR